MVGLILTVVSVKLAYIQRGNVVYGGEWLILPLILMVVEAARDTVYAVKYLFRMEDDFESDRD